TVCCANTPAPAVKTRSAARAATSPTRARSERTTTFDNETSPLIFCFSACSRNSFVPSDICRKFHAQFDTAGAFPAGGGGFFHGIFADWYNGQRDAGAIRPLRAAGAGGRCTRPVQAPRAVCRRDKHRRSKQDRKSTRLNSSHVKKSYAAFCSTKNNYISFI